jgi:hypothetical protein
MLLWRDLSAVRRITGRPSAPPKSGADEMLEVVRALDPDLELKYNNTEAAHPEEWRTQKKGKAL